jgi:hypothetical protein
MSVQMDARDRYAIDSGMSLSWRTVPRPSTRMRPESHSIKALAVREIGRHRGPRLGRQAFPSRHNSLREPVRHGVPGRFRNRHTLG